MSGVGAVLSSARTFFGLLAAKPTSMKPLADLEAEIEAWRFDGWRCYMYDYPDQDVEIEIRRVGDARISRVIPRQLNPEFNVAGFYWRPIAKVESI